MGSTKTVKLQQKKAPVQDAALAKLLDQLKESDPQLYLVVGLVALYGLRPAELAVMEIDDTRKRMVVWNNTVKRNTATADKEAWARYPEPLDIPGREGAALLNLWRSGKVKLPERLLKVIRKAQKSGEFKPVGNTFNHLLGRLDDRPGNEFWKAMLEESPSHLTPYSLRHSYAWREHRSYRRRCRCGTWPG